MIAFSRLSLSAVRLLATFVLILTGLVACVSESQNPADKFSEWGEFRLCDDPDNADREKNACGAVGRIVCNGKLTANGFIVHAEGSRIIVVTNASALVSEHTGKAREQCRFNSWFSGSNVPLDKAVALTKDFTSWSAFADIAVAQLRFSPNGRWWSLVPRALTYEELEEATRPGTSEFSFLSHHGFFRRHVVSGYDCAPLPKNKNHLYLEWQSLKGGDCDSIGGLSGSPGMIHDSITGRYNVFCVNAANFTAKGAEEADPTEVSVSCARITPYLVDLIDRMSRDAWFRAPGDGLLIDFVKQGEELGYP